VGQFDQPDYTERKILCNWLLHNVHDRAMESQLPFKLMKHTYLLTYLLAYSLALVHKRTIPTEQLPLVSELVPTSVDRECHVVGVTDPYGRILGI
jgi:hypothetical protein